MRFVSIPLRNIRRRLMRSVLTILGIGVAVASFVVLVCMSRGIEQAWVNSLVERGIHMLAISKGSVELLTASIDEMLVDDIRKIEGVRDVTCELVNLVQLEESEVNVLVRGWPVDSYLWESLQIRDGSVQGTKHPTGVVIGQALAEILEVEVGETMSIHEEEFVVTGISAPAGVMDNSTVFLLLPTLQGLMGREGKVTEFDLRLDHPEDPGAVQAVQDRLRDTFSNLSFIETSEIADNNEILRVFRAMAWGTSLVAIIIALVVILNTLLMSVTERTREIGVLSAVGWRPGRILAMIVIEGLVFSMIGSIVGFALGISCLNWLIHLPELRGLFEPEVTIRLLLEILAATLFLGVAGSMYPASRAVRLNPVDALKYE